MEQIECVPNFSEGRRPEVIEVIAEAIRSAEGVELLHIDPGAGANRTVMTFAGPPPAVVEAAFRSIKMAAEKIDMQLHQGAHPRLGATDVCPLIPLSGIDLADTVVWARRLAEHVGQALGIPVYLYEAAATHPARKNLADIRRGEYEGLVHKLADPVWKPDFGPARFHERAGATIIGARPFLAAYNVNLNTDAVGAAKQIARRVRESGFRAITGKRNPGRLQNVKALGWYIEEYRRAQVSMNITDLSVTGLHQAYEACRDEAKKIGVEVTGSELVGMIPLWAFLEAGRHYTAGGQATEKDLIWAAIDGLGLADLSPFVPEERIIEYRLQVLRDKKPLSS